MAARRLAKRRWPRVAVVALGLAGGCLSGAAPPSVPPGWTVHFHQDTPYVSEVKYGRRKSWRERNTASKRTSYSSREEKRALSDTDTAVPTTPQSLLVQREQEHLSVS